VFMKNTPNGLDKVDLNAPFDLKGAWNELLNLRSTLLAEERGQKDSRGGATENNAALDSNRRSS